MIPYCYYITQDALDLRASRFMESKQSSITDPISDAVRAVPGDFGVKNLRQVHVMLSRYLPSSMSRSCMDRLDTANDAKSVLQSMLGCSECAPAPAPPPPCPAGQSCQAPPTPPTYPAAQAAGDATCAGARGSLPFALRACLDISGVAVNCCPV